MHPSQSPAGNPASNSAAVELPPPDLGLSTPNDCHQVRLSVRGALLTLRRSLEGDTVFLQVVTPAGSDVVAIPSHVAPWVVWGLQRLGVAE